LIIHDTVVSKTAMHKIVAPLVNIYSDVTTLVASSTQAA
jgi:carbamoyltransferase